ncbi:phosphatase PAP2 family protein [Acetobacteraceae bacterium KSS8]|uniref:Phosphatase PAP2 family protein n=1 Tax=Endosaccharibacter trunci TaxID=2812733 RepID=A0ABT1WAW2_9PROT|nr:phosphatase PAP2 family protein [Acetobacteraceae bacterium KSS8]
MAFAALLSSVVLSPAVAGAQPSGAPVVPADPSIAGAAALVTPPVGGHRHAGRLPPGTYISGATLPDTVSILPPPPLPGSPEQTADQDTFDRARALEGTPRWALATRDADLSNAHILADFSCALGVNLDPAKAPTLARLLAHADADMSPEIDRAKQRWQRKRPFIGNDKPICVARSAGLSASPSYPSGHTTLLYGSALILAELAPDRATAILQRGRSLSESRIVCGVHWLSDVQAGFIQASSLVAALNASAAFRADLDKARAELAALRATGGNAPEAGECAVEADAAAHSPLFQLQPAKTR